MKNITKNMIPMDRKQIDIHIVILLQFLIILIQGCSSRSYSNGKLIGEWTGNSQLLVKNGDTVDYTLDKKGYSNMNHINFESNGKFKLTITGRPYLVTDSGDYHLKNDAIFFNDHPYPLLLLNDSLFAYKLHRNEDEYFILGYKKEN